MIWQPKSFPGRLQIKRTNGFMINAEGHFNAGTPQNKPPRHDPSKAFPLPTCGQISAARVHWDPQPAMISNAQQIPPPSFLWKPSLIPLPSAHAELSRVPNGLEFSRATARTEPTGRARESIDANHWETSTKNDTGSASKVLGYAWVSLQPNCGRSLEVSSRSVSAAKKRPFENIKELVMLFTQVHSVAEPSSHN